jgi:hypothetical protein
MPATGTPILVLKLESRSEAGPHSLSPRARILSTFLQLWGPVLARAALGGSHEDVRAPAEIEEEQSPRVTSGGYLRSNGLDEAELGERSDAVVEADLLDDLAVLKTQDCGAGEVHLPSRRRGQ